MAEANWVGIDVSKARLDVAVLPSEQAWQVSNDASGHRELVNRLHVLLVKLIPCGLARGLSDAPMHRQGFG